MSMPVSFPPERRAPFRLIRSAIVLFACATFPRADGLMESPPARNWFCGFKTKPDEIATKTAQFPVCATAFAAIPMAGYNFMTVVTHSQGRANTTPLPTHVCSFDSESWKGVQTPWDVPMEWPTTPMQSGPQNIVWNAAWGGHFDDTRDFSYWITKPDFVFSPAKELTWNDFEAEPFCVEMYDDKNPTANPDIVADKAAIKFSTRCQVPVRTGHHVIYGEWGRTESTWQRFHGCIDGQFGATALQPKAVGKSGGGKPGAVPAASRADMLGRKHRASGHTPQPGVSR
jgi:chitin-binding protein